MLHACVPLLLDAWLHLPALHDGDSSRVALEGYPGLLARELIGRRPYKSDDRAEQSPERLIARIDIVDALDVRRAARQVGERDDVTARVRRGDHVERVL